MHGQARPYTPAVAPVTGGVGSTGHGGNVGVVYPAPGQVIYQGTPVHAPPVQQPIQYQAPPNVYNPYHASSYTSSSGYGGYGGYGGASYGSGGYGTGAGVQGSPSNIYNPNYNGANYYAKKAAQDASQTQYAPPVHSPVHGSQPPGPVGHIPVAQPAPDRPNPPPSAPPGYY